MFKIQEVINTIPVFKYAGVFDICDNKTDAISNILTFAYEFAEASFEELMEFNITQSCKIDFTPSNYITLRLGVVLINDSIHIVALTQLNGVYGQSLYMPSIFENTKTELNTILYRYNIDCDEVRNLFILDIE
jgi:hypothetical protein